MTCFVKIFFLSSVSALLSAIACAQGQEIRIAAASDLSFAMGELSEKFEKSTGAKVSVTYGSSGNFFSQIQNGAPFDLFFSADISYPKKLAAEHLADAQTLYEYAVGRIVIWAPADVQIDVMNKRWYTLLDPGVQKIAIANPEHAPYGQAAVAALQNAGIYDRVKAKLVYGENISQAAQFVQSGNAQAGIIALSLASSPAMKGGKFWKIPQEMYPAIEQGAIVLRNAKNKNAAMAFLEFARSKDGRVILEKYGFVTREPGIGSVSPS